MADRYFGSNAGKVTVKGGRASRSQREILGRALAYADKHNAPYAAKLALVSALIVESEAKNLSTPSADGYGSYGVLQGLERYHGKKNLMNPEYQFSVFLGKNKKWPKGFTSKGNAVEFARRGMAPGDIAQAVEGSAYPDRYAQYIGEAKRIIRAYRGANQGGAPSRGGSTGGSAAPNVATDQRQQALLALAESYTTGRSRKVKPVMPDWTKTRG